MAVGGDLGETGSQDLAKVGVYVFYIFIAIRGAEAFDSEHGHRWS